jgi:hypothetical protein
LFAESATVEPLGPAAPLSVTVPVDPVPPTTEAGLIARLLIVRPVSVNVAVAVCVPAFVVVPVMVSVSFVVTTFVVTEKVPELEPAGIVIEAGTVALALLEDRLTVTDPPVATVPTRVAVPVEVPPPTSDVGLTARVLMNGGNTVSVPVPVPAPPVVIVAVIVQVVRVAIQDEVAVNVFCVAPAGMTIVAGTERSDGLLDVSEIVKPPVGAFTELVTVTIPLVPARICKPATVRVALEVFNVRGAVTAVPPLSVALMVAVV